MELMSQGSYIQVLAPQKLVEDMKEELNNLVKLYEEC